MSVDDGAPLTRLLRVTDRYWTHAERIAAVGVLIVMVAVAAVQAGLRNLAGMQVPWASAALQSWDWTDTVLQKGTLWLAFIGASLATRQRRHIRMDLVPRLVSERTMHALQALTAAFAAITCGALALAFWRAVMINATEVPAQYELLVNGNAIHVCDAARNALDAAGLARPTLVCLARSAFQSLAIPVENGASMLELIVPAMFSVMALRFCINSVLEAIATLNETEEGACAP